MGQDPEKSFLDFGAGVQLSSEINKASDITIGFSLNHITTPENFLLSGQDRDDLPMLFALHGRFNTELNDTWSLSPGFIFQRISTANEIGLQALVGYKLGEKKDMTLRFGPGYRMVDNDAIEAIVQFDYKQFRAGVAYDFNVSSLSTVSNGAGGFEIAASYIARIFKQPTVKPVISVHASKYFEDRLKIILKNNSIKNNDETYYNAYLIRLLHRNYHRSTAKSIYCR